MEIEKTLESLERTNNTHNYYITIVRQPKNDRPSGVLNGAPVGLKDIIYTKGIKTTAASNVLRDFVPQYNATITDLIESNGGRIVCKTNLHEFACGATNTSKAFGPAKNPSDDKLITGGSSGGSAGAVGIGDLKVSIGTDTGGSVRIPAAFCGVYGFKPSFGRISRYGVIPTAWTHDNIGIFGSNIEEVQRMYGVLKSFDPKDPPTFINTQIPDIADKKIKTVGLIKELTEGTEVESSISNFANKISSLVDLEEVSIPELLTLGNVRLLMTGTELAAYHTKFMPRSRKKYGTDVLRVIEQGAKIKTSDYLNAQRFRSALVQKISTYYKKFDLLLCPSVPVLPPSIKRVTGKESEWRPLLTRNVAPFNLTGAPAISVPVENFVGAQLVASYGEDSLLLNFVRDHEL